MITIDEIELRIATLKKALFNIPVDSEKFWNIKKEMDEYVVLREIVLINTVYNENNFLKKDK